MSVRSYLNIEGAVPSFTISMYWDSGWFLMNSYSTYSRKWFMKELSCYKNYSD